MYNRKDTPAVGCYSRNDFQNHRTDSLGILLLLLPSGRLGTGSHKWNHRIQTPLSKLASRDKEITMKCSAIFVWYPTQNWLNTLNHHVCIKCFYFCSLIQILTASIFLVLWVQIDRYYILASFKYCH